MVPMATPLQDDSPTIDVDDLDPSVLEELRELDSEAVQDLIDGKIDQIPEDLIDRLPPGMADRVPEDLIAFTTNNPALTAILVAAGILGVVGFMYGVAKSAFKAAAFFAIVAAVAWIWFLNR